MQKLIFSKIGDQVKPGSFKRFMDVVFVFFEKIAFSFDDVSRFYIEVYEEMVDNELNLLSNYHFDTILVVGSGSIPATPILIAEKTNARVVCIDIDEQAIRKSKRLIKKLHLNTRISVETGDGVYFSFDDYDAIFILYGMKSQKEIIEYLAQSLPQKLPVILRVVSKNDYALIDNNPFDLSTLFKVKNKIRSHNLGLMDSYLLEKDETLKVH